MDYLIKAISKDKLLRGYFAVTTDLVDRAAQIHLPSPAALAALGRSLTATVMLGSMQKGENVNITLQIKGDGPLGTILCVADAAGHVKGYVMHPEAHLPLNANGKLDVGGLVGQNGELAVIRDIGLKEPYIGRIPLVSGEIAEDMASYFAVSEQVPSAVALGVLVDTDLSCKASGGYILQLMPGAQEEDIARLEEKIQNFPSISSLIADNHNPEDIMHILLDDYEMQALERIELSYVCDCSQKRVERALISMGKQELESLQKEQENTEITCQFCDKIYRFSTKDIEALLKHAQSKKK